MTGPLALVFLLGCGAAFVSMANERVENRDALPTILLLGDSIRLSYAEVVVRRLARRAVVVSLTNQDDGVPLDELVGDDGVHLTPAGREVTGGVVADFPLLHLATHSD